jgi:hypothetical protein
MRRSRPTGSGGGSGVLVAAALVALLLTAHSCSGGGAASLVSEMSGPAVGRRSGGRLDEIGRDCANPERINVVPRRCGRSRGLGLCRLRAESDRALFHLESVRFDRVRRSRWPMIGSPAVGPQLELTEYQLA